MSQISRRSLLKSTIAGGVSLLTFNQLFKYQEVFAQPGDDLQTILNLAATSEMFATTHYYSVLTESTIALSPDEREILLGFLDAELQHLEYLFAYGAMPVVEEYYIPENVYNDRDQFSQITEEIETAFVGAYLAGVRQFAELGQPLLSGTAAQVAAIEQEHLALVRGIGSRRPNNNGLARAIFFNVSEAVPALQSFFEGGPNYAGPIAYPGADAIRDLVRDAGVVPVAAFTDLAEAPISTASEFSTVCSVTPGGNHNCNLRSGPSLDYQVLARLAPGETTRVNGQSVDNDGFPWWRLENNIQWVRSDIVRVVDGTCERLPEVLP